MTNQPDIESVLRELNAELLPCPHCGAIASLDHRRGSYGYYSPRVVARCSNQNCPGVQTFEWDERYPAETKPKAEAEAIAAWNTRADLAAHKAAVAESLSALDKIIAGKEVRHGDGTSTVESLDADVSERLVEATILTLRSLAEPAKQPEGDALVMTRQAWRIASGCVTEAQFLDRLAARGLSVKGHYDCKECGEYACTGGQ